MKPLQQNIAICDIGTQTFRLAIVNLDESIPRVICSEISHVRLGQGLSSTGVISDASMKRAIDALNGFHDILSSHNCPFTRAVATHALRCSANADLFLSLASKTGFEVMVISEEEEAKLAVLGVTSTIPIGQKALVADAGGGSTELTILLDGKLHCSKSIPIGCVTLTERFLKENDPPSQQEQQRLTDSIDSEIKKTLDPTEIIPEQVIGVGGSATTMASIWLGLEQYQPEKIRGLKLTKQEIDSLWNRLSGLKLISREKLPGLSQKRADIILAGIAIFKNLIKNLFVPHITITDGGLLMGLLIDTMQKEFKIDVKPSHTAGLYI